MILQDLEPKKVVNILYQDEVFDLDEMEEVTSQGSRKAQAELLLGKVSRSGDRNIAIFVNALRKTQKHLYDLLQRRVPGEEFQAEVEARVRTGLCSTSL